MKDPLETVLAPGPVRVPAEVARALAATLTPAEAGDSPPEWLHDHQARAFRRLLAILRRHRGSLLADPPGSGKTFTALAVARAWNSRRPTVCLVPAAVLEQWRRAAERVGVPVLCWSHEMVSRGAVPPAGRGLVIIDESHRFRSPGTRRYRTVAPWLVGRPALLLSGTPIVNRLGDLARQLLLAVRDDALGALGVPSLHAALLDPPGPPAIGELLVSRPDALAGGPRKIAARAGSKSAFAPHGNTLLDGIDALRLSAHSSVAALMRVVLWRALTSSLPALGGVLERYRNLLLQARDASAAGRTLTRADLRGFITGAEEQLVLWSLLPESCQPTDLALDDLEAVGTLLSETRRQAGNHDPKFERLAVLLGDGRVSLVFVSYRETLRYLRSRLRPAPAWCTGDAAGIGAHRMARGDVLGCFRPFSATPIAPRVLIATDVAAEGLDLHAAERVIHYDLPWTAVTIDQRDGRAARLGSPHRFVEIVRFEPPPAFESRLAQGARLARKGALPSQAGIGAGGESLWRWREMIHSAVGAGPAARGVTAVSRGGPGLLAGISFTSPLGGATGPSVVSWWSGGEWSDAPALITEKLCLAARANQAEPPTPDELAGALRLVRALARRHLQVAARDLWRDPPAAPETRTLLRRLRLLAQGAVRQRDTEALEHIDRALRFAGGGHTAGEQVLVQSLSRVSLAELRGSLPSLPDPTPPPEPMEPHLEGLILFRS